ncbi:MAG TPA: CoA-transferase [Acidimicrobiia bacterium]|nr:CoA-transferase [Acidimicrobiia bacterium]
MTEFGSLRDVIADLVPDGASVAMEGFTHLIPFAAGHEVIRQDKRDLTLLRMTPDLIYDQLIGVGCARRLVFSWGGNPGVGSLHRFRDAVENEYPSPLDIEEHSHAGMAARYVAGASGLPFGILRGYRGSDLVKHTDVAQISCPFTGEELAAVPALNPDVAVIHAQQADRRGNVGLWGITGVQREAALAASTVIVTVEEIVDELAGNGPNQAVLPHWTVSAISQVPKGSHPSYSMGYTTRDNRFYREWDRISRDREVFARWVEAFILEQKDFEGYLSALDDETLLRRVVDG